MERLVDGICSLPHLILDFGQMALDLKGASGVELKINPKKAKFSA